MRRKFPWPFFPALAWIDLCGFIAFLVEKSNEHLKLGRSFGSLVDEKNLLTLDSATRRIGFIIRRCFRINELTITTRILVFLEKLEASSSKLKKNIYQLRQQRTDICIYRVSTMIPGTCFITSSYTSWHATFFLVPSKEVMMNEVVVHFDK